IVLIDDEPAIRLAIGDYLHSMGYTVITACEGPMAFLEMMLWLPNCIISDIRMPGGIDGVQLLGLLRHKYDKEDDDHEFDTIPVILLTAKAMVSDRIVGYKAGADGYIPKPFRPDELLGMVDNLMRRQERERVAWMESNNADDLTSGEDLSPKELIEVSKELIGIKRLLRQR
ncbi:response regulator, partial [Thalassiosira pseudonana CCMP1335]